MPSVDNMRPVILIDPAPGAMKSTDFLRKEVEKYGWRLYNISSTKGFLPRSLPVAGALVQHSLDDPMVKMLMREKIPFVRVGTLPSFYFEKSKVPSIGFDMKEVGRLAARFFAERGFNELAYIGSNPMVHGVPLFEAFKELGSSLGCKVNLFQVEHYKEEVKRDQFFRESSKQVTNWIKSLPKPVGLLAYSDNLANRYISYLIDAGIEVPKDVAVLGVGNTAFICETSAVSLSSIDLPWSKMWLESCRLLNSMINEPASKPEKYFLAPTLVSERESTEVVTLTDLTVKSGLQFIWENYSRNIGVEDLIQHIGVSRRTLQRAFQDNLGRGINEEIRQKRLDVGKRLLLNTDDSIKEIAQRCGYNSSNYFNKAFVKSFEQTPLEYRQKNKGQLNLD
jgi:LacI family transcriptional regulator